MTTLEALPADPLDQIPSHVWAALQVSRDFLEFLKLCHIEDVETHRIVRYRRWRHLLRVARTLQQRKSVIILKARQLGITWLIAAYILWRCTFEDLTVVLVISKDQKSASDVIRKIATIYRNLPPWAKQVATRLTMPANGVSIIEWANGSRVESMAPTETAGRSLTASIAFIDEAAFHPFAVANYAAYMGALGMHGQLVMVSTSNGPTGLFATLYKDAKAKVNDYTAIFIPWWARPDRQEPDADPEGSYRFDSKGRPEMRASRSWWAIMAGRFKGTPAELRREYPNNEAEAWTLQSGLVYGLNDNTGDPIFAATDWPRGNLSPDPIAWEDCHWHYALVDWGGGDPTAVDIWGVTKAGRIHQFREYHWTGATPTSEIHRALYESEPTGGYDKVICGRDAPNSIAELASLGFRAEPAEVDRKEGFGVTTAYLEQRRITHNPETCAHSIAEYDSYYWATTKDPVTKESFATRTANDHHGDHKDLMRYLCMEISRNEDWMFGELPSVEVQRT